MLYFGPRQGWDFSVTIFSRNSQSFRRGLCNGLAGLIGQTVRVRGLLDTRFGPQIEISNPDEIEVIELAHDADRDAGRHLDPARNRAACEMGLFDDHRHVQAIENRVLEPGSPCCGRLRRLTAILLAACASMEPQDSMPFNAAAPVPPPRAAGHRRENIRRSTGA